MSEGKVRVKVCGIIIFFDVLYVVVVGVDVLGFIFVLGSK